jgi:glucoamylase
MNFTVRLFVLVYISLVSCVSSVLPIFQFDLLEQKPLLYNELEVWLDKEEIVALERLLANIAPHGQSTKGAVAGSVIASPSRLHPDYFYQWVRDAAITISTLVDLYADDPSSSFSSGLSATINEYASLQYKLQHTENPSGGFKDLAGLGEPKFEADGSAFRENWGRPQRDGPALRAITLISFLREYNASNPWLWGSDEANSWFGSLYQPVLPPNSTVKADLEYVSHNWNHTGFDLWEEVEGMHFFTAMVQHRALREGAELASAFSDVGAANWYTHQAELLSRFISDFWNENKGHLVETLESDRSGLDCGVMLGSIHGLPSPDFGHRPIYPPYSDEILVTLLAFVQDQWTRFPINLQESGAHQADTLRGVGLGRYPEDIYDGYGTAPAGGNPWFLCTATAAEILFRTVEHLTATKILKITDLSLPFYSALLSPTSLKPLPDRSYNTSSPLFQAAIERLKAVGDEFLSIIKKHADGEGSLSEQFDKVTGFERGARDLTWSYGAFLQAVRARKKVM